MTAARVRWSTDVAGKIFWHDLDDAKLGRGQGQKDILEEGYRAGVEFGKTGEGRHLPLDQLHHPGIDEDRGDHGQADEVDGQVARFQGGEDLAGPDFGSSKRTFLPAVVPATFRRTPACS